ncbi:HNH endonuclease [Mycolicibacterium fortuitum]
MARAPKLCGATGCTTLVRGHTYCPHHQRQRGWRRGGTTRTNTTEHRARHDRVLQRDGYQCSLRYPGICIGTATICDHIVALTEHGADSDDNCQAACEPCHRRKTSHEGHRARWGDSNAPAPPSAPKPADGDRHSRSATSGVPRAIWVQ